MTISWGVDFLKLMTEYILRDKPADQNRARLHRCRAAKEQLQGFERPSPKNGSRQGQNLALTEGQNLAWTAVSCSRSLNTGSRKHLTWEGGWAVGPPLDFCRQSQALTFGLSTQSSSYFRHVNSVSGPLKGSEAFRSRLSAF